MLKQEPTVSISDLVPILGRSRTSIAWWAKRYRIGRRVSGRRWRFTQHDIEQLRQLFGARDRGVSKGGR